MPQHTREQYFEKKKKPLITMLTLFPHEFYLFQVIFQYINIC